MQFLAATTAIQERDASNLAEDRRNLAEDRKNLAARQEKAAARQEKAMSFERRLKLAQALNDTATLQKLMDEANEDEAK